jgi:hypothetical protein
MTTTDFKVRVKVSRWSDTQKREFAAIDRRARAFTARPAADMFDKDGNVIHPTWLKILADLDAWAARHKAKLSTTERDRNPAVPEGITPIILGDCPSRTTTVETMEIAGANQTITTKYTCYLKRRGLGSRCIYRCSSEQV